MDRTSILTRAEAAAEMQVSLALIDRYLKRANDPLPHSSSGRKILIPRTGFLRWLEQEAERQSGGNHGSSIRENP